MAKICIGCFAAKEHADQTIQNFRLHQNIMNNSFIQGLTDAISFVAGGLLGMILARLMGLDPLAEGYGMSSMLGIALCGIGGGLGVQIGRRFLLPFLQKYLQDK